MGDVFERRYFPPEKEGKIMCIKSFIMVAQTSTPNIIRSDVSAVFLAARPNRAVSLATQLKTAAHLVRSKTFDLTRKYGETFTGKQQVYRSCFRFEKSPLGSYGR